MASIRTKNTKPEQQFRSCLFKKGFRFRKNVKSLPGSPDIVLTKYKSIIFINGCFWHGHKGCTKSKLPKTNTSFWRRKIETNQKRDSRVIKKLRQQGWIVSTIWECQIKNERGINRKIELMTSKFLKLQAN